jgi:hypothetical protein
MRQAIPTWTEGVAMAAREDGVTGRPVAVAWRVARWAVPFGSGCLLALAVLFLIQQFVCNTREPHGCFHSDSLYVPSVCRNLLGGTWSMSGTHMPGAPYLFPDIALMLPCLAAAPDLVIAFVLYALAFYGLLALAVSGAARQTGLAWPEALSLGAGGVALLLATCVGDEAYNGRTMELAFAGNHVGGILVGLFLLTLALRWLRGAPGPISAAAFVLAGGLAGFSDKLLLAQFLLPLALTFGALTCLRVVPARRFLMVALCAAGAAATSLAVKALMQQLGYVLLRAEGDLSLWRCPASCVLFFRQLPEILSGQYLMMALVPACAFLALAVLCLWAHRDRAAAYAAHLGLRDADGGVPRPAVLALALFLLLSALGTLGASLGLGAYQGPAQQRYFLPVFYLPFLFSAVLLRLVPWPKPALVRLVSAAAVGGFVLFRLGGLAPAFAWGHFRPPYPDLARALDRLARERGIRYGLAEYWLARHESFLTQERVRVKPITLAGSPWLHAEAPCDYLSPDPADLALPRYQFILCHANGSPAPAGAVNKDLLLAEYGAPRERQPVGDYEIWLYDSLANPQLDRFLKGVLAGKVRRCRRFTGPASPATLARPKDNFVRWDAPGNQVLQTGQQLEAVFARPLAGSLIDFAADWATDYELTFWRGPECVGRARAPAVPWAHSAYEAAGTPLTFARLVPLPDDLRRRQWDRVLLRPSGGGDRHAVAHLLVYRAPLDLGPPPVFTHERIEAEHMLTPSDAQVSLLTDSCASGGMARQVEAGRPSVVVFRPCLTLDRGRYRATFAVKLGGAAPPAKKVGRLVLSAPASGLELACRELVAEDFAGGDGYRGLALDFGIGDESNELVLRLDTYGVARLAVDYVDLTAVAPGDPGSPRSVPAAEEVRP